MLKPITSLATDVFNLLFPDLCGGCGRHLFKGEQAICTGCLLDMPYTDFHLHAQNRVAQQLWNRLPLANAMAMLYFNKGTKTQRLLHQLKYEGQTAIGAKLGQLLGQRLKNVPSYADIDVIVPVPLHPKKQRLRGYNQSKFIGDGIAEVLGIPCTENNLMRKKMTESQTKKTRYNRFENMLDVFTVTNHTEFEDKHVLLIDDVVTTGATLEACGHALLQKGVAKLSIACIAYAV